MTAGIPNGTELSQKRYNVRRREKRRGIPFVRPPRKHVLRPGRWPTNGVTLSPPVLVALFLRRHGWSRTKIARCMGITTATLWNHMHAASVVLGVSVRQLDMLVIRGGELKRLDSI